MRNRHLAGVLYNDEIKRAEIIKNRGKRMGTRKATQRLSRKGKVPVTDTASRRDHTPGISAEMLSLEVNAKKFARYAGQWLLLANGKLIAHSGNYSVIAGEIARKGLKDGLVYYVPRPEESNFVLL